MRAALVWFGAGAALGCLNALLVVSFVARLCPVSRTSARRRALTGYLARYALAMLALAPAIRQGLAAGLAAAAGLWVARWLAVYLGVTGKLDRVWSG